MDVIIIPCVSQPAVQDVLAHFVLRPAPVQTTSSVTDLLETAFVKVEETTANKVHIHTGNRSKYMDFAMLSVFFFHIY